MLSSQKNGGGLTRTLSTVVLLSLCLGPQSAPATRGVALTDGEGESPVMVVVKVTPEWGGVLPEGPRRSTGIGAIDAVLRTAGVACVERLHPHARVRAGLPRLDLVLQLHLEPGADPWSIVACLECRPELSWAEVVRIPVVEEVPDDPQYPSQHHLTQIKAPDAWAHQKGDSAVVIAVVDNGTDYLHPDLWANVFTNELEAAGVTGVDDDGNGYVDDVHGYDIAMNDADPCPCLPDAPDYWYTHGTLTAGAAAAVTNNALGVASISWNCEYMPVKCSYDDNPRYVSTGYPGIAYAAETGADVITCSWGRHDSFSQYSQDVIDYATGLGSVVIASAGDVSTGQAHYPSAYFHVVSVTWVDGYDHKASDAGWGRTVDLSAPGVDILTTAPGSGYAIASGSSFATPIAAGLAGLIKSWRPTLDRYELSRQLVLTADKIDALNPGYEGLLGTGRVNALAAVTADTLEEHPYLETWSYVLTDSVPDGNGNGLLEQGETASFRITYRSYTVSPAQNATVTLSTTAPGLTVVQATSYEGDAPADTLCTCRQALTVSMGAAAFSRIVEFLVTYQADGGFWQQDTLVTSAGRFPILLVDDDDGEVNVEGYYLTALDSLGLEPLVWTHAKQGEPDSAELLSFPLVVWSCEAALPSLTSSDREALAGYLNQGGHLFMSGQDIGWDLCDPYGLNSTPEALEWYESYLHATYVADDSEIQSVEGIPGDPIGDGLAFSIHQPGRPMTYQSPSVISPSGDDACAVFCYEPTKDAAVRYSGDHAVVYMGFGFEAVASGSAIRTQLMARVIDYLGPIVHTPLRDTEDASTDFTIAATMTSPSSPDSLWLRWTADLQAGFQRQAMSPQGSGAFEGVIPAPVQASDIWYYLETTCPGYTWNLPTRGTYQFHAGPDTVRPTFSGLVQLPPKLHIDAPRPVTVLAYDNLGLDLATGSLHYGAGSAGGSCSLRVDTWVGEKARMAGELPSVGSLGDTVFYWCSIADTASVPNTGHSDTLWYVYGLEDFECELEGWDTGTGWGRTTSGNPHSGQWAITDSPAGQYGNNEDNSLTYTPGLDLETAEWAGVSCWAIHGLEDGHDFLYLEVSKDGLEWTTLHSLTGRQMTWTRHDVTLNGFLGSGCDSVLVRFRLVSDDQGVDAGAYLDDVLVSTSQTPAGDWHAHHAVSRALTVTPNPSRGSVWLTFQVPRLTETRLHIYDIAGRLVATAIAHPGQTAVRWAAEHQPSGMYYVRTEGIPYRRRIILIR